MNGEPLIWEKTHFIPSIDSEEGSNLISVEMKKAGYHIGWLIKDLPKWQVEAAINSKITETMRAKGLGSVQRTLLLQLLSELKTACHELTPRL